MSSFALALGYIIGMLPLGSGIIRWGTKQDVRGLSAHDLGVENLLYFTGKRLAVAAFLADVFKGCVAVVLAGGNGWAAVGVVAGHFFPLLLRVRHFTLFRPAKGHGNALLLGTLIGFAATGTPILASVMPVAVFLGLWLLTRYLTVATLGTVLLIPVMIVLWEGFSESALLFTLIALLVLWQHRSNLIRLLDRTEPRLGHAPAVRGTNARKVYAAFMIHPMTPDDWWQPRSGRWLAPLGKRLPLSLLKVLVRLVPPQKYDEIQGIELADGRQLSVILIGCPLLPEQIRQLPDLAVARAIQAARLAYELGAEAFGLGAFWSTVGEKGLKVQEAVPEIAITNGGAYTAASVRAVIPLLLERYRAEGHALDTLTAAVVGANGVVAFGVARTLAGEVGKLILIGRDAQRLARSAATLQRKYPHLTLQTTVDMAACKEADLIVSATSDPEPVLYPEHVKVGAWLYDLGRPADVAPSVVELAEVDVIPGGVVSPPGEMRVWLDLHFGQQMIPACMAETMIMTAAKAFDRRSLGPKTKLANIDFFLQEGERLGFALVTHAQEVVTPGSTAPTSPAIA